MESRNPAVLLLEDGTVYHGAAIGKIGTSAGEIAFNTGMTGYQEVFTDPSYYGQMLIMTTAHIGNYGVHAEESESKGVKLAVHILVPLAMILCKICLSIRKR
jgi:carbamoyl-phosphate synthase small subunit